MRQITVALTGNPNAGKTTIFNALTGLRQHVGNYPGVTVETKEGFVEKGGIRFRIVDLPGTYSLSAHSPEEVVARDFLVMEKPDMAIQVVDASNMERNLYLATQIMELGLPLVMALNMTDVAKARGIEYDVDTLRNLLRIPVVPTVGNKRTGVTALLDAVLERLDMPAPEYQKISYPGILEDPVNAIDAALAGRDKTLAGKYPPKWLASRLFENDPDVLSRIADKNLAAAALELRNAFEREHGDPPEVRAAEAKYGWIAGLCAESVRMTAEASSDVSDRIDSVVLHRLLGLPIFLVLMYLMFQLVFTVAEKPMEWIEAGFGLLAGFVSGLWPEGAEGPLRDLLVDGVIGGVGGVLVFLPNIILLFLAIAFLEDTGYMARAAFVMDRMMHKIGLHGKSFIPMLLGFGCTVPAIMSARTLENRRDRLTTILVLPFISCGARLPIYVLIIPAFFPEGLRAWMLWLVYAIGIVFAVAGAKLLRRTLLKGDSVPFVMELPPYRMPAFRSVAILMWDRAGEYVKKAGTIILGASILLWAMTAYPKHPGGGTGAGNGTGAEYAAQAEEGVNGEDGANREESANLEYSVSGRIGQFLEPVFRPIGFDWRIVTAIVGSFAAKEVFVAQMGIIYSVGAADGESDSLREKLRENYTPLQAFCMMLWALLSLPCVATVAVAKRETGGWKWVFFMMLSMTVTAYAVCFLVYQTGGALGIGVA